MDRNRLERIVCEKMVCSVCGNMEVVEKMGCLPTTEGYKEAKRIFNEKYTLITFSELEKEIVIAWYSSLLYKQKIKRQIPQEKNEKNENYLDDLFNKIADWVVDTTVEDKLNGISNEMKENTQKNSYIIREIDSTFNMIINMAKDKEYKGLIDNNEIIKATNCIDELHKIKWRIIKEKIDDLDLYINKSLQQNYNQYGRKNIEEMIKKKHYFLSALFQICEDDSNFIDGYFKQTNTKVLDNIFENGNYNTEIDKFTNKCFEARKETLDDPFSSKKRKRNKTSETILEKAYKKLLDSVSVKDFRNKFIEFRDVYTINLNKIEIQSIIDYYNIEKRYNLKLNTTFIQVLVDYPNITKEKREEFLRRLSKLAVLDNCLFRHMHVKEVAVKIANELLVNKSRYYDDMVEEIKNINGIKYYIVNKMLEIDTLQYKNLENENIGEVIMSILDVNKDTLMELAKIDLEGIEFLENEKIKKNIYKDIRKLLNMSKDICMESNEYINL